MKELCIEMFLFLLSKIETPLDIREVAERAFENRTMDFMVLAAYDLLCDQTTEAFSEAEEQDAMKALLASAKRDHIEGRNSYFPLNMAREIVTAEGKGETFFGKCLSHFVAMH